jgi:type IV secretory pathway TraG/TraD family ATPase VirD4
MRVKEKVKWGAAAPSIKRIDPNLFFRTSLSYGAMAAVLGLWASWRPIPGFLPPPGLLSEHFIYGSAWLVNHLAPHIFVEPALAYQRYIQMVIARGEIQGLYSRLMIGTACSVLATVYAAWRHLVPKDGLIFLRGAKRFDGPRAVKKLTAKLARSVLLRPDHEIAPGIFYPADLWTRHILIVAGTGAGKSTVLKPLVEKIVKGKEQMLLFDPKGEFTRAFAAPILIAPWDERGWAWDLAADMRNIGFARRFATATVKEGTDPMWANAARQLVVGSMLYLKATQGVNWNWRDLADTLALPQPRLLSIMKVHFPEAIRSVERTSVTTQGVLINLTAFCSAIFDLADAWSDTPTSRRISFYDWITQPKRSPHQIILQGNGGYPDITKSYVEGIFSVISGLVNSVELEDSPNRKMWIICEELPQMGKIPIRPLFELGRSRGIRCIGVCQDLAQLEEIHGEKTVKSLVSMSGSILIGQVSQGDTAETLAKALGGREVERRNISISFGAERSQSVSYARESIPLYTASELGSRLGLDPKRGGVTLALALEGDAYELFWPTYRMKDVRSAHVPSKWALGLTRPIWPELPDTDDSTEASAFDKPVRVDTPFWLDDDQALPSDDASSLDDLGWAEEILADNTEHQANLQEEA